MSKRLTTSRLSCACTGPRRRATQGASMSSTRDTQPEVRLPLESELQHYFDVLWREASVRENRAEPADMNQGKVRLDCNRDLVDLASIAIVGVRSHGQGADLVEFLCPR